MASSHGLVAGLLCLHIAFCHSSVMYSNSDAIRINGQGSKYIKSHKKYTAGGNNVKRGGNNEMYFNLGSPISIDSNFAAIPENYFGRKDISDLDYNMSGEIEESPTQRNDASKNVEQLKENDALPIAVPKVVPTMNHRTESEARIRKFYHTKSQNPFEEKLRAPKVHRVSHTKTRKDSNKVKRRGISHSFTIQKPSDVFFIKSIILHNKRKIKNPDMAFLHENNVNRKVRRSRSVAKQEQNGKTVMEDEAMKSDQKRDQIATVYYRISPKSKTHLNAFIIMKSMTDFPSINRSKYVRRYVKQN
ncbi:hypothetical protein JYU34_005326 [Plutella xylostella]|uniref:Uncharacterized protein n=1 Tax=Plutella xylostella TaxID=51655 RepID=A0ABQ7QWE3_PLUXY|nr:hypothetical protein JYU34_005326 [Plutella xylostella]